MSTRRQLERRMRREGSPYIGGVVSQAEFRSDAMELVGRLLGVLFERQPCAPMVLLLALEVARRHVVATVDETPLSDADRERFWAGVEDELRQYDEHLKAGRS